MKKLLCLLLALLLLPQISLAEDAAAEELTIEWKSGSKKLDAMLLSDGLDHTGHTTTRNKTAEFIAELKDGVTVAQVYARFNCLPDKVELQYLNAKRKWETIAAADAPGVECLLVPAAPAGGKLRLLVTFSGSVSCKLAELRSFTAGALPALTTPWQTASETDILVPGGGFRLWQHAQETDVLVVADSAAQVDPDQLRQWISLGRSVMVGVLSNPADAPAAFCDQLWAAGVTVVPLFGGYGEMKDTAQATLKAWSEKKVVSTMTGWIRRYQPLLVVTCGDVTSQITSACMTNAADITYTRDGVDDDCLWLVSASVRAGEDVSGAIRSLGKRDLTALRAMCAEPFAGALHSDPALIPYPAGRDAEGYLTEGEFVFEDAELGLWAYLSPTLQVEIIRYDTEAPKHRWFMAEVKFKPEQEQFKRHLYVNATFKDQQIYPKTLAQSSKLVFAVNGDYYLARADKKSAVGNIVRDYRVLYNVDKTSSWPNLDTLALHDDGTLSVYDATAITADALAARGDVHDALSFGPYLVDDSRLRIYNEKNANAAEPRCAVGMIDAGHYIFIDCEGRVPDGTKGLTVNETAMILYSYGVTEAFNLDGGSTSVILFMGKKLNRTGKDTSIGQPRNQHELFGVGTSELVHTDWLNGKP